MPPPESTQFLLVNIQHPEGLAAINLPEGCEPIDLSAIYGIQLEIRDKSVQVWGGQNCVIYHQGNVKCNFTTNLEFDSYTAAKGVFALAGDGSFQLIYGDTVSEIHTNACKQFPGANIYLHVYDIEPKDAEPIVYRSTLDSDGFRFQVEGGSVKVLSVYPDGKIHTTTMSKGDRGIEVERGVLAVDGHSDQTSALVEKKDEPPNCGTAKGTPDVGGTQILIAAGVLLVLLGKGVEEGGIKMAKRVANGNKPLVPKHAEGDKPPSV